MSRTTLSIDGMSCSHCVSGVRRALEGVPGVTVEEVEIGTARVGYDDAQVRVEQIRDAVEEEGYAVRDVRVG